MKKLTILFVGLLIISCSKTEKKEKTVPKQENKIEVEQKDTLISSSEKSEVVASFLKNVKSLKKTIKKNSISDFKISADLAADKSIILTKENINASLKASSSYTNTIIIVGEHTIVRLNSLKDCSDSRSWNACMPKGEGYIKKGELVYQNDYINNIIGLPTEDQERVMYFFN